MKYVVLFRKVMIICKGVFLRQHRTELVVQMRSQIFRQIV